MRLKEFYQKETTKKLATVLVIKNINAVPKVTKISINIGLGQAITNQKLLPEAIEELKLITGQKPTTKKAKKAISGFKVRQGQVVGLAVTLRGQKMYDFMERLINIVLPRIRDFRGLNATGFDKHGNYSLGFREQTIFPELKFDEVNNIHGLQINIASNCKNDKTAMVLLEALGFPFKKKKEKNG